MQVTRKNSEKIGGIFDKIVHIYTEKSTKWNILYTKSVFYSFLTYKYGTFLMKCSTFVPSKSLHNCLKIFLRITL